MFGNSKIVTLEDSLRALTHAQATLTQTMAAFLGEADQHRREMGEIRGIFKEIMAVLADHTQRLSQMPEAVRERMGFKPPPA